MTADAPQPIAPEPPATGTSSSPWTCKQYLVRLGLPAVLLMFIFGGPVEQLLLGWLYFPLRVLPRVTVDWPTAILGLVSCVAFVAGLHITLKWFLEQAGSSGGASFRWSFRSSCAVAAALVLMFWSGTAMVGATHQFLWLFSSRESHQGDEEARSQRRFFSLLDGARSMRDSAMRTHTKNQLKQVGLAIYSRVEIDGRFPPGGVMLSDGTGLHGWPIFLSAYASFFEQGQIDFSIPWNQPPNDILYRCQVSDFVNPTLSGPYFDEQGYGLSHYAANVHVFPIRILDVGAIPEGTRVGEMANILKDQSRSMSVADITDGVGNTIMLGTVRERFKPWGHPANVRDPALGVNRSPDGFGGPPQWQGGMFLTQLPQ